MPVVINGTTGIVSPKVNALDLELDSKNVVERGSNANGVYVRFADGTQICTHTFIATTPATAGTPLFGNWDFPAAFGALPNVQTTIGGDYSEATVCGASNRQTFSSGYRFTAVLSAATNKACTILICAIGRWY